MNIQTPITEQLLKEFGYEVEAYEKNVGDFMITSTQNSEYPAFWANKGKDDSLIIINTIVTNEWFIKHKDTNNISFGLPKHINRLHKEGALEITFKEEITTFEELCKSFPMLFSLKYTPITQELLEKFGYEVESQYMGNAYFKKTSTIGYPIFLCKQYNDNDNLSIMHIRLESNWYKGMGYPSLQKCIAMSSEIRNFTLGEIYIILKDPITLFEELMCIFPTIFEKIP